jgi:hypothetical protein
MTIVVLDGFEVVSFLTPQRLNPLSCRQPSAVKCHLGISGPGMIGMHNETFLLVLQHFERLLHAAAGLEADERGRLKVNKLFQTAAPPIYAAGDVIGPPGSCSYVDGARTVGDGSPVWSPL